eukprot:4015457-Prymnesium_polylepis.1
MANAKRPPRIPPPSTRTTASAYVAAEGWLERPTTDSNRTAFLAHYLGPSTLVLPAVTGECTRVPRLGARRFANCAAAMMHCIKEHRREQLELYSVLRIVRYWRFQQRMRKRTERSRALKVARAQ